jgi:enterochelin esterase-like enzyme
VIGRRRFLGSLTSLAVATAAGACSRREQQRPAASEPPAPVATKLPEMPPPDATALPRGKVGTETWTFDNGGRAVIIVPSWTKPDEKLPVLFALHGRGEANKGPVEGVMGWPRDYALIRAIERVCAPPITTADLEGFADPKRLADLDLRKPAPIKDYGRYLLETVLPRVRAELPVLTTAAATGIDGVSLGGAVSLRVGLVNPDAFGAVGSLQAALGEDQVAEFTELAKAARAKNAALKLRLLTSKEDYFRGAISRTSLAWRSAGIDHDYADVPGPHDYPFNRGPGAIEMLLWHDRMLAHA